MKKNYKKERSGTRFFNNKTRSGDSRTRSFWNVIIKSTFRKKMVLSIKNALNENGFQNERVFASPEHVLLF